LNSDAKIYSSDFQGVFSSDVEAVGNPRDGLDASATISVGPYSMLVFSQDV
jgi:1,4-alpha-glucan branching enzyme